MSIIAGRTSLRSQRRREGERVLGLFLGWRRVSLRVYRVVSKIECMYVRAMSKIIIDDFRTSHGE